MRLKVGRKAERSAGIIAGGGLAVRILLAGTGGGRRGAALAGANLTRDRLLKFALPGHGLLAGVRGAGNAGGKLGVGREDRLKGVGDCGELGAKGLGLFGKGLRLVVLLDYRLAAGIGLAIEFESAHLRGVARNAQGFEVLEIRGKATGGLRRGGGLGAGSVARLFGGRGCGALLGKGQGALDDEEG